VVLNKKHLTNLRTDTGIFLGKTKRVDLLYL
jgi:hypothetical protein